MQVLLGWLLKFTLDWLLKTIKREVEMRERKAQKEQADHERAHILLEKLDNAKSKEERVEAARNILRG